VYMYKVGKKRGWGVSLMQKRGVGCRGFRKGGSRVTSFELKKSSKYLFRQENKGISN
jgi:hypothetical protein